MTSPERIVALCEAVDHIQRHAIPGAIVECGVWRGGSMMAAARTLLAHGQTDRELWLYDTFEGMTSPRSCDVDYLGRDAAHLLATESRDEDVSIWCVSPLDTVKHNLNSTGYPPHRIRYVVGDVQETLKNQRPDAIALLRLDTDWYESTRCELEQLFPRLVPGGILLVDDYGHWRGCRRAVDEYFAEHHVQMMLSRIDYTGRMGVKTRDNGRGL
jgi:hypothetical protein